MKQETMLTLITMFKATVVRSDSEPVAFPRICRMAMQRGYIVEPEACTKDIEAWLESQAVDYNATFYKDWHTLIGSTDQQLLYEQILHYMTTYGTDFEYGNGFTMNDGSRPKFAFSKLVPIKAITEDEMFDRCMDMLRSGIALKQDTVSALCDFVINSDRKVNPEEIKNREAKTIYYVETGTYPDDGTEIMRCLIYRITRKSLLIKDRATIDAIKNTPVDTRERMLSDLDEGNRYNLAKVFNRFKPLLLAFKVKQPNSDSARTINGIINHISHRSKVLHVPMEPSILDHVGMYCDDNVKDALQDVSTFRKLRILNYCGLRLEPPKDNVYIIRNGKLFMKENTKTDNQFEHFMNISDIVLKSILNDIKDKKKTGKVRMPKGIVIAVPTSEKSFVGDYPFGTTFELGDNNVFGVYWKNEWGAKDIDFAILDNFNNKIGWNTTFRNNDLTVMHSGDMTNAVPEAAECIYIKNTKEDDKTYLLSVDIFNGKVDSKYRFMFARYDGEPEFSRNYMIDPDKIAISTEMQSSSKNTVVGIIRNGTVVLTNIGYGNQRVSGGERIPKLQKALFDRADSCYTMESLLILAGFEMVGPEYDGEVDLDLVDIKRDSIIKFFSK